MWRFAANALLLAACVLSLAAAGVCVAGLTARDNPQLLDAIAFALLAAAGIATLGCVVARFKLPEELRASSGSPPPPRPGQTCTASVRGDASRAGDIVVVVLGLVTIVGWLAFAYQSYFLTQAADFSQGILRALNLPQPALDRLDRRQLVFGLLTIYAVLAAAYLGVVVLLFRAAATTRTLVGIVVGVPILAYLILGIGPGLLSTDILSYAAYGHLAGLDGVNPYITPPSDFPADPFMAFVTGQWRSQPSVYGPLWNDMSGVLSRVFVGTGLIGELLAYRALADLFQLVNMSLFWILLSRWPSTRGLSLPSRLGRWALFSWNPNLLIEVGQSGHNDIVIVSSIILSLLALAPGRVRLADSEKLVRWLVAVLVLVAGALVKFVPLALIPVVGFGFWVNTRSLREWVRIGALTGVFAVGVFVLASVHWMSGSDVLLPFRTAMQGGPVTTNDLPHEPAQWITARFLDIYSEHTPQSRDLAAAWISAGMRLFFGIYVLVEFGLLWRLRRDPEAALAALPGVCARFLTLLVLLVLHQVRSWYFIWAIPLAGVVQPRSVTGVLVVLMGLCAFPALLLVNESIWPGGFLLMLEIAVPAAVALLVEASGRWRQWQLGTSQRRVPAVIESRL